MKIISVFWRTLIWSIFMLVLFLVPAQELPGQTKLPYLDKLAHLALFMVFTILYLLDRLKYRGLKKLDPIYLASTFLLILFFAVTVEFLQKFMDVGRIWDIMDILWDIAGFFLGLVFVLLLSANRS